IDPGQIGQGIPAEYPGDDIIDLFSRSVVGIENQMKQQIAALRADAYSKNIDSLADSRKDKSAAEIEALKIRAEDLQRQIDRDANLDDRSRDELRARLQMHRETLAQRAEEERGRTRRHELSEDGRNTRAREQQAAIDRRAQAAMKAGIPPTQMLEVINKSLDAMGMNSIHDLDEDTVESFNNLVDSALQGLDPQFGYQPGGWFGWGSKATVSTGAPLNPQPQGVFPQEQPPQSFQPAGQPMNLPPLSPGKVYVSGPDGEGLFELPEAQLNDYLKANPKAKAYRAE
ncbi:MAG TPA: hypothetical protein VLL97_06345, partial [Acidobacteriota bacterium]|nr:hypothetical protein [Acidobacteriota bacterium]